jgi:hypothetical protein
MTNQIDIKYLKTIPEELVNNYIIPYTYEVKPKTLLLDIVTFQEDYNIIKNLYAFNYNYSILLHDLVYFCNSNVYIRDSIMIKFKNILKRNFILSNYTNKKLVLFVYEIFYKNKIYKRTLPRIKFLWGLLSQRERTEFINIHLF